MKKPIFCVGGATIDCKIQPIFSLESATSNPSRLVKSYGGVARNVAHTLSQLTQEIHLQCVVGNDSEGRDMLSFLQEKGIHIQNCMQLSDHPTAQYFAILQETGELHLALAVMEIYEKIPFNLFTQHWQHWPDDSIVFIDTNLPTNFLEYALAISKRKNLRICIDPVSTAKSKKLPICLEGLYLLKPDIHEAKALTHIEISSVQDCVTAGKILLDRGVQNIVISLGKKGYVIINNKQYEYYPAFSIDNVLDVSGAGDAFIAGILFGLQQNVTLSRACQMGAAAAALTIQTYQTVADLTVSKIMNKIEEQTYAEFF